VLLCGCLLAFIACSAVNLPPIDDPARLTKDCDVLLADPKATSANNWPDSIVKLHPVMVEKEGGAIWITTFAQTGVGAWGYVVCHSKPGGAHYSISETAYAGIYRFDFKP
jgi:hypothetical protein